MVNIFQSKNNAKKINKKKPFFNLFYLISQNYLLYFSFESYFLIFLLIDSEFFIIYLPFVFLFEVFNNESSF